MQAKQIYFAGDLFDHKHLVGNALLAQQIEKVSNGRYKCVLPQNNEIPSDRTNQIRDLDLQNVLSCDVAIFNFDGTDLDSGTVVEFCYAKMVDVPSVQFRSDFRLAGDQSADGDPWNLMASGFPRTKKVALNSMALLREFKRDTLIEQIADYHAAIAQKIIDALDEVCSRESLFKGDKEKAKAVYKWATISAGGFLPSILTDEKISEIIESKSQKGLI